MHSPNPQLSLDRTNERRPLEQGARQIFDGAGERVLCREGLVQAQDTDVLLSGRLLGFDETGCAVDADDQDTGDHRVEGARMACFLAAEDALDPCDDFVRAWTRGLVKGYHSGTRHALSVLIGRRDGR